jgi:hypothetical protein
MDRTILVASFILPEKLDWLLELLLTKFKIEKSNVFLFKNLDDDSKIIATFKLTLYDNVKINLNENFPGATIIHKKGNAIYTINALNNLIELDSKVGLGNIIYENYQIDWSKYQNKMILTNNGCLVFINIERIF